ncbi:MAG: phage terminase large subunit family protein [Treponema sp.]|jgi:phage terminase large subunit GpA-like protein|nr:phage terminase large subunit family protein [Treponema sp.]
MTKVEKAIRRNTRNVILTWLSTVRIDPYISPITEWAARNRYLPEGTTEHPGFVDPDFAPYTLEIKENFFPDSPYRIIAILKGTQSLITTAIEDAIGHSIKYGLHNILYVISTASMAAQRSSASIDVMINNSGLKDRVRPIAKRKNQRKSGDTLLYKELAGGRRFSMTSYKSIAALKSFSWDLIVMDEIDEAPPSIKGQGDPEAIIEVRGKTIDNLKIAKLSTPTQAENSRIWKAFKSGDRREYMIPCPRCGGFQFLEMMKEGREYGLYGDYTVDKTKRPTFVAGTARYKCKLCGEDFFEYEKPAFMREKSRGGLARWEPQAEAQDPRDRSYHVSSMMSPMTQWSNILVDYAKTGFGQKLHEYKSFVINTEGLPFFTNRAYKPWLELKEAAEDYPLGEAPEGGLIITGGVDVQKNRLELQLVAWGYGMEGWSFYHGQFIGATADVNGPAWSDLLAFAKKLYTIPGTGTEVRIGKIGVDASYNPNKEASLANENLRMEMNAVYAFCKRHPSMFVPVRGVDGQVADGRVAQKRSKAYGIDYYLVDVTAIKQELFENIDRRDGRYAVHFSRAYPDEFFRQFLSEIYGELDNGKMGYKKIYERNEALDTFIYARAAMNILGADEWSDDKWDYWKDILSGGAA